MLVFFDLKHAPPAPPWATAAAAVMRPGRGGRGIDWNGDTPRYYTQPQNTIQSPKKLYRAPTDCTKPPKDYAKPRQTIQRPKILDKDLETFNKSTPKMLVNPIYLMILNM